MNGTISRIERKDWMEYGPSIIFRLIFSIITKVANSLFLPQIRNLIRNLIKYTDEIIIVQKVQSDKSLPKRSTVEHLVKSDFYHGPSTVGTALSAHDRSKSAEHLGDAHLSNGRIIVTSPLKMQRKCLKRCLIQLSDSSSSVTSISNIIN